MRVMALVFAGLVAAAPARAGVDLHGAPLPRGSRPVADRHASALGFRATVDWYTRQWRRDGIAVRTVGPYAARGVDVVRFLREDDAGDWLAVHVYRVAGKTWIFVVPRPGLDAGRTTL